MSIWWTTSGLVLSKKISQAVLPSNFLKSPRVRVVADEHAVFLGLGGDVVELLREVHPALRGLGVHAGADQELVAEVLCSSMVFLRLSPCERLAARCGCRSI